MEILISFYDNALIYYPNNFFAVLFSISILGIISVSIGIIVLWGKIRRVIEKIKNDLEQIERIKIKERKRVPFIPMVRIFFEKKKISFVYITKSLTVFFIHMVRVAFVRINTALGYIESQAEKIVIKIKKEILID